MCRSMIDIQSATAEIRRGKKKKNQDKDMMSASATQCGHNKVKWTVGGRQFLALMTRFTRAPATSAHRSLTPWKAYL